MSNTFLFSGFSFTDPNIYAVLSRIRVLLGTDQREHFMMMRRPSRDDSGDSFDYESRLFRYQIEDLTRFSTRSVWVDEFSQIPPVLR
mgnify:CR=1 FL=1